MKNTVKISAGSPVHTVKTDKLPRRRVAMMAISIIVLLVVSAWVVASIKIIQPKEVGLVKYFGTIEDVVYKSGPAFVPYFWGIELIRIPRKQLRLDFVAENKDEIRSLDRIRLYPEISVYVTFPYDELESLLKMVQNDVPLTEDKLKEKYEDVIMPAVQEAFKDVVVADVVRQKKVVEGLINTALREREGILFKAGITGIEPTDNRPGHGWVSAQIESTGLPEHINEAMEAPVIGKYKADAARQTSLQNAQEIGLQVMITAAIVSGVNVQDEAALKAFMDKVNTDPTLQTKPASKGGFKEAFAKAWDQVKRDRAGVEEVRIGNADGSSMKGELPAFAAAALLLRNGGVKGGGKRRGGAAGGQGNSSDDGQITSDRVRRELERIDKGQ